MNQPTLPSSTTIATEIQHESSTDVAAMDDIGPHNNTQSDNVHVQLESRDLADKEGEGQDMSLILHGKELALVFIGIMLAVFLTSLDQTIISPALPVISSRFLALDKIAWLPSAYLLSQTTFLLLYGQALDLFDRKWTFIGSVLFFELGSLLCAVTPDIELLIFGRAVAGLGASGVYVSNTVIIADITTLERRPALLGLFGIALVLASILGPIIGGAFTQHVTWRWVFYINLPIGAVTLIIIIFTLKASPPKSIPDYRIHLADAKLDYIRIGPTSPLRPTRGSFIHRLLMLDWLGSILGLGVVFMLLLAFQWGGSTYAWSSSVVIGLLVGCGVSAIVWVLYEHHVGIRDAVLPLAFLKNRSVVGASMSGFFAMMMLMIATYYLPLQFQAVKQESATSSGLRLLPFLLGTVVCAALAGAIVSRVGRYWHILLIAPAATSVGFGLMYTFSPTTSNSRLIGYQIIASIGTGCLLQNTLVALHANVDHNDISRATAMMTFFQRLGGVLGVSIAGTVFANELVQNLEKYAPDAPRAALVASVEAIRTLPDDVKQGAILAYSKAIDSVYLIGVPAGFLTMCAALLIRNVSVKGKVRGSSGPEKPPATKEKVEESTAA